MNSLGMYIGLLAGGFIKVSPIVILVNSVAEGHISGFANLFGNIALFVPLGIALFPYVQQTRKPLVRCALTALFLSAGIESIQLLTGRIFDLCDIVQNFTGCLLGYYLYNYVHQVYDAKLPEICTKDRTKAGKRGRAVAAVILLLSVIRIVSPM